MKALLIFGALTLAGVNSFAASVCMVTTGVYMGVKTTVTCDGKLTSSFSTDKGFDEALTNKFKDLIEKGYKLQGTTVAGQDPERSYIFIKE